MQVNVGPVETPWKADIWTDIPVPTRFAVTCETDFGSQFVLVATQIQIDTFTSFRVFGSK